MKKEEKRKENQDEMVNIVENILDFNQNQEVQGLKILATNQRISRLPITLAQLRGVHNSEKLKNEIRQQLHSLYRS